MFMVCNYQNITITAWVEQRTRPMGPFSGCNTFHTIISLVNFKGFIDFLFFIYFFNTSDMGWGFELRISGITVLNHYKPLAHWL